jgi:hypothetical protein
VRASVALLLAATLVAPVAAGPASDVIANATSVEAECAYLLRECRLGKAARDADPGYVEHPSGAVFATTSPEGTRHVGNALEAAAAMRLKHDSPPACIAECDALLKR